MTLADLNYKYFCLFSDLRENESEMPPKQCEKMATVLMKEYDRELDYLLREILLETAQDAFEQKVKLSLLLPKRFLWWKNRTAKAVSRKALTAFEMRLKELERMSDLGDDCADQEEDIQ